MPCTARSSWASKIASVVWIVSIVGLSSLLIPSFARAANDGAIRGVVIDSNTGRPIDGALVVLQCACLNGEIETSTNVRGVYRFEQLPPGRYTVQTLTGQANVAKFVDLPRAGVLKVKFEVDPQSEFVRVLDPIEGRSVTPDRPTVAGQELRDKVPLGDNSNDAFNAIVLSPTATQGASGGFRIAGNEETNNNYTVDGADVNSPAFGTVGISIINEFVDQVEVREAGYDAEFGGASGGQVAARRISGSNDFRGLVGFRINPRLARPRFVTGTDEALRVTLVPDLAANAYATVSGPIVRDRLYFSVGVSPTGTMSTLEQRFFRRLDRDGSGGFEDCPFQNGDNDCAAGQDYIATERFAEQTFRTGAVGVTYVAGLDFNINPRHSLRLSSLGGPGFSRTTYRLPFSADPNAFGTNPSADPLGGTSRIATGVVNDHFGWDFGHQTSVSLGYTGRVANDNLEIDALVGYFQSANEQAWRLDDPGLRDLPVTQEQTGDGRNLYEFLDREGRTSLVPGVAEACNDASLPGTACPIRAWLSGGIGKYDRALAQRIQGKLSLTHYISSQRAGNHQVKYGIDYARDQSSIVSKYSGSNSPDFRDNCPDGQPGGGEWCYDPVTGYALDDGLRVNNNRLMVVNPNTPESLLTQGYGRVRREEDDLRAIASASGDGVRVPAYRATTSTDNYGVYLQDRWSVLSNLYLNYGVRWELQDMNDALGRRALLIADNVAPRLGVVYDWTDEGRSRLYASYGWFFQPLPLQLNNRVFGGLVNVQRSYRLSDCFDRQTAVDGRRFERYANGQPTEYCVDGSSGNTGFTTGLVPANVVPNLKGSYNQQFQLGYEQEVLEDLLVGVRWLHNDLGRAVEDISTDGGNNFIIANPGEKVARDEIERRQRQCNRLERELGELESMGGSDDEISAVAREAQRCNFLVDAYQEINTLFDAPSRNYDAWTLQVQKRFANNWLLVASYTYSRLVGNYEGFVDPTTGAINLGASTQYDIPELVRNSYGPLAFNQPHVAKLDGYYSFDLGQGGRLTVGTSARVQSGYAIDVRANQFRYPGQTLLHLLPRGTAGRIAPNYRVNLSASYAYPLPRDLELEISARFVNVTNAKGVLRVDDRYSFQFTRPIPGGTLADLKHAKLQPGADGGQFFSRNIVQKQGNFGVETSFQSPLSAQFDLRLRF